MMGRSSVGRGGRASRARQAGGSWRAGGPAGCATGEGFAYEGASGFGAAAPVFPAVVEEPRIGGRVPFSADDADGIAANGDGFVMEGGDFAGGEGASRAGGVDTRAPEDFVRHPVADAGETLLSQQDGFDWSAGVVEERFSDPCGRESPVSGLRGQGRPPFRWIWGGSGPDFAKHAGV